MYWHTQHPAANAICLLLYTDRPSLHRRSNHPRWVLTGGLDHSGRDFGLNPDSPLDGAKTTNIGAEIPCRFSVTFSEGTHKPESHKHTKVHDVRANSCSLTYGLGWGQQLEARCLLRMSRAVSLGLYFSDTQYRVSQPTLADCSHTVRTQKAIYSKHKINPSTGCSKTVRLHVYPMLVIHKGTILSEPSHGSAEGWYDYVSRESKRREFWPPSIYQRESSKTVKAH